MKVRFFFTKISLLPIFASFFIFCNSFSQAVLIKDFAAGVQTQSSSSTYSNYIELKGIAYFTADDGISGGELWRSDGTMEGTYMLKDINSNRKTNSMISDLTLVDSVIYFVANQGLNGIQLWKTNGTKEGTKLFSTIARNPNSLVNVNGTLYFSAIGDNDQPSNEELWKSDGTVAGTKKVKEINPSLNSGSFPKYLTNMDNTLYFVADNGISGEELWRSDGTILGTYMVKEITTGSTYSEISSLIAAKDKLYFVANDGTHGHELWLSDGTSTGTLLVKDINPEGSSHPEELTAVNDSILFNAFDPVYGRELWISDGTTAGTMLLKDIGLGLLGSQPSDLTLVNNTMFFSTYDSDYYQLWKTDFTETGTVQIKQHSIQPPSHLVNHKGKLYYSLQSNFGYGKQIYRSDGTEDGTNPVKDFPPGINTYPSKMVSIGDYLFLSANSIPEGEELWISDGTKDGTRLVKDINLSSADGNINEFTKLRDENICFSVSNPDHGGFWKSDGTSAGTIKIGNEGGSKTVNMNGTLLYTNTSLWKSDGTSSGTMPIVQTDLFGIKDKLTVVGDTCYFVGSSNHFGEELWQTDGTTIGTKMVIDLKPGKPSSNISNLESIHNSLYFHSLSGEALYRLDKSVPVKLASINSISSLTAIGNDDIFYINENTSSLYKVVENSVQQIYKFNSLSNLIDVNGTAFFFASSADYGLWKSNGTNSNTILLKKNCYPRNMTNVNNTLFFTIYDKNLGNELWKSDGTAGGTVLIKDINPGAESSEPSDFFVLNDIVYFAANDGIHGKELWRSDGTNAGTYLISDVNPGASSSFPCKLIDLNNTLVFVADHPDFGQELWKLELPAPETPLDLSATPGENIISITWNDNSDSETGFEVYRTVNPLGEFTKLASLTFNTTYYVDMNVKKNIQYFYKVRAVDSKSGNSPFTTVRNAKLGVINKMDESSEETVVVYPNPTKEKLFITLNNDFNIEIVDMMGRSILNNTLIKSSGGIAEVNISELAQGMYMAIIKHGYKTYSTKFIKSND